MVAAPDRQAAMPNARVEMPCAARSGGIVTQSPKARLAFFKLNVPDMERALAFWTAAFDLGIVATFDEPEFLEHILASPGEEAGPSLMLVRYKDGREVEMGTGHGPVGFVCEDIEASHAAVLAAGARAVTGVFEAAGVKIAIIESPEGHAIELVQPPA